MHTGEAIQLYGILHLGDGRETEEVLAIGADLHKGNLKETDSGILRVDESVLEHSEVGTWTVINRRSKGQGGSSAIAEADDIHGATRHTCGQGFLTEIGHS